MMRRKNQKRYRGRKGQAMVELALIAPLTILFTIGTVDLMRAGYHLQVLNRAAREALRQTIVDERVTTNFAQVKDDANQIIQSVAHDNNISLKEVQLNIPNDLVNDPITVTVQGDFDSLIVDLLSGGTQVNERTLTLEAVSAGFYEDIGFLTNMNIQDRDRDGIADVLQPEQPPAPPPDSDQDGDPNYSDPDDDNDGIPDGQDGTRYNPDTDGDGILDGQDDDIDGDGVSNADEGNNGTNPFSSDTDGDGIPDPVDTLPNDRDNDGIPDPQDGNDYNPDVDNDGILDSQDNDIDGDGIPNNNDPRPFQPDLVDTGGVEG